MKSRVITTVAILLLCVGLTQAQTKIGYVNSLELLGQMPEIKKADSVLQSLANDLQKQYSLYVMEYQQKLDDYNKNYIRINTKMWKINSMAISTKDRLGILESSLMRIKQK